MFGVFYGAGGESRKLEMFDNNSEEQSQSKIEMQDARREGKDDRALKEMIKRLSHKDSFDKLYVKMSEKLKGTSWQKEINQRLNSIQEDKNMKEILQEFAGPSAAANIDFSEYDVEKIATEILKTEDFQVPENIKKEIFEEWKEILSASGGGS